jgi:hypothetical protein
VSDISRSLHGRDAMMLEPLGFIQYNEDRTRYWGLSAAAHFSVGQTPAWGGVLHLGKLRHVGYLYRPTSPDDRHHVVSISVDLLKAVAGRAQAWRDDLGALQRRIAECPGNPATCVQAVGR